MKHIVVGLIVYFLFVPLAAQAADTSVGTTGLSPSQGQCTPISSPSVATQVSPGSAQWTNVSNIESEDNKVASFNNFSNRHIKDLAARLVFAGGIMGSVDKSISGDWSTTAQYVSYGNDTWGTPLKPSDINSADFGFALQVGGDSIQSNYLKATHFGFQIPDSATVTRVTAEVKRWDVLDGVNSGATVGYIDHIRMTVCYQASAVANNPVAPPLAPKNITIADALVSASTVPPLVLARINGGRPIHVAPGKKFSMPLSFQYFSGSNTPDMLVSYQIRDGQTILAEAQESVLAIDEPIFPKIIAIPASTAPGTYDIAVSLDYNGHHYNDVAVLPVVVEYELAGIYISQIIGVCVWIVVGSIIALALFLWSKHRRDIVTHDYGHIAESDRMYYEMIGDMISQMHDTIGDRAYKMADSIGGLSIDKSTGKILNITKDPSEIVSILYIKYQTVFKRKLKILSQASNPKVKDHAVSIENDLAKFEKYFGKK